MNKMLTISLVTVLGIAGGGAYFLMDSDKKLSDYVPESVSSLLGDYIPGLSSNETMTLTETMDLVEEEPAQVEQSQAQDIPQMVEAKTVSQEPAAQAFEQEMTQQIEPQSEDIVEQDIVTNDDNAVEIAMDEIQKSLNEIAEVTPETTSKNPAAIKIGEDIKDVASEISRIDLENKALEEKFQNILRQNRELAKKLQAIDKEIADAG